MSDLEHLEEVQLGAICGPLRASFDMDLALMLAARRKGSFKHRPPPGGKRNRKPITLPKVSIQK